MSDVMQITSSI